MTMEQPFEVVVEERRAGDRPVALVKASGEVDLTTAGQLAVAIGSDGDGTGGATVLDLTGVTFMDSSGLRVLLVASRNLGRGLGVVVADGSAVKRLLDLAEVTGQIACFATVDSALAGLAGNP